MEIVLQGSRLELTPEIKEYVDQKIGEVAKFIPEGTLAKAYVEVEKTTNHHKQGEIFRAEVNLEVPGTLLRAESKQEDLFQAITEVKDELQRELKKYKERQQDLQRRGGRSLKKRMTMDPLAWKKDDIHDKNL